MRAALWQWMLAALLCAPLVHAVDMPAMPAKAPFAGPITFRGTLGEYPIQASLRPKEEFEGGVEGEYFVFGRSHHVLLAGEAEGDEVLLEESENGTDVSGLWSGILAGDTLAGEWQSADGKVSKPFRMTIVRKAEKAKTGANIK